MPLFRRKKGEPEVPTASPPKRAGLRGRRPTAESGPPPGPAGPTVANGPATEAPPPLPTPAVGMPAAGSTGAPRPDYSECFVCGTALQGKTCPTCRMTWVE